MGGGGLPKNGRFVQYADLGGEGGGGGLARKRREVFLKRG